MKLRIILFLILSLIAPAGCGRVPGKKPIVDDPVAQKDVGDPAAKRPPANDDPDREARVKEFRKAAEEVEAVARQSDPQIGKNFTVNMMLAAVAWAKAGDKVKAFAAAQAAIAAGPDDRSPAQTFVWHTNIADVFLQTGEVPLAVQHYEAALKSSPNPVFSARTQKKLDDAKAKLGNPN